MALRLIEQKEDSQLFSHWLSVPQLARRSKVKDSTDANSYSNTEFEPGKKIGGRYEVISRLGKGGMGLVYKVNQVFLNNEFALETLDKNCMSDITIRRFQHEARTAFALKHPNIVAVNDFGILDDDSPFLVMELIKGETVGERLKRTGENSNLCWRTLKRRDFSN